jgi:hypothetical protein
MKFAIILSIIGIGVAIAAGKHFQRPVEVGGCDAPKIPAPTGKPYAEGQAFAGKILSMIGLPNNVEVYVEQSPEVGWSQPQYRRIYVGTASGEIYKDGKINWRAARAITHGVGDMLNQNEQGERDGQNEADEFSGWIMRRLGATHEQAMAGIVNEEAKAAMERGWRHE